MEDIEEDHYSYLESLYSHWCTFEDKDGLDVFRMFVKCFKLAGEKKKKKDNTVVSKSTECFSSGSKSAVEWKGRSNYTHIYRQVRHLCSDE